MKPHPRIPAFRDPDLAQIGRRRTSFNFLPRAPGAKPNSSSLHHQPDELAVNFCNHDAVLARELLRGSAETATKVRIAADMKTRTLVVSILGVLLIIPMAIAQKPAANQERYELGDRALEVNNMVFPDYGIIRHDARSCRGLQVAHLLD